jgi:hypothetical protein
MGSGGSMIITFYRSCKIFLFGEILNGIRFGGAELIGNKEMPIPDDISKVIFLVFNERRHGCLTNRKMNICI